MAHKSDHLCVLVHGLWGNPSHLDFLKSSLRERYDEDRLYILAAKGNSGNFTYDGIELGGERLAHEIEDTLGILAGEGNHITKLSIVGYSLGGLVARYALGLLYARGWFDKLEPVNFTTFVTPHVGVRMPLKGFQDHVFNAIGARTLSTSGRQLFLMDSFRDTGKPLLSILADSDSIFMQALAKFRNRSVYGNIVNDRSTHFFTTVVSTTNPFQDLGNKNVKYVKGYEPVVIDPDAYFLPPKEKKPLPFASRLWQQITGWLTKLSIWLLVIVLVPIAISLFLLNAVVQTYRSRQRIRLHEDGKAGVLLSNYRVPIIVKDVQSAVEGAFENVNGMQDPDYLPNISNDTSKTGAPLRTSAVTVGDSLGSNDNTDQTSTLMSDDVCGDEKSPTLALTPAQFSIINSLNSVGFRKYPVWIHNHRHSHAAIIVRVPKKGFEEGGTVVKHWLDNGFDIE
ncbi:lipase ROG1 family protein [Aspergillus clavatus NRRL 1]|uniref:Lipase/serine esterase, putative n=1 Tax=Aspergillus clavatus (strain ATCC 1007 / CBS 513.65 / DSM 816 / NCTC 3887 / NRRL 1 / QM 1276 / 107) TaxID=344612 RepID=A1CKX9_ASPCL|nr:lipase/serine esterase, putative [Aspergillus clavatus NRRL 1]EAW09803.1 lipase/serine esterase, putative [Aspergillus clavatus NRRL 1]